MKVEIDKLILCKGK